MALSFEHVSYGYPGPVSPFRLAVDDVSLHVRPGKRVVVLGQNGSGKSTLAALANGSLSPASGRISIDDAVVIPADAIALVRQDPSAQFVCSIVEDDVAFGPLNLGLEASEVEARVREALELAGVVDLAQRDVGTLSGGQQQRVALAGALALHPNYLVLDEASSQLDSVARKTLRTVIDRLLGRGVGILEITHLAEEAVGADRAVVLSVGRVAWEGSPQELYVDARACQLAGFVGREARLLRLLASEGINLRCALTNPLEVCGKLLDAGDASVRAALGDLLVRRVAAGGVAAAAFAGDGLRLDAVTLSYEDAWGRAAAAAFVPAASTPTPALVDVSLSVAAGSILLLGGPSGSGKTTAALVMAGLARPDSGRAILMGREVRPADVGLAFQRPESQLFANTVLEDVAFGARNRGVSTALTQRQARDALKRMGVGRGLWGQSPLALSGGEARRVALAGIMAMRPAAYVFDEPTAGLDGVAAQRVMSLVRGLATEGAAVVVISHEVGAWLQVADGACLLSKGRIVWSGSCMELAACPEAFLAVGLEVPLVVQLRRVLDASH